MQISQILDSRLSSWHFYGIDTFANRVRLLFKLSYSNLRKNRQIGEDSSPVVPAFRLLRLLTTAQEHVHVSERGRCPDEASFVETFAIPDGASHKRQRILGARAKTLLSQR